MSKSKYYVTMNDKSMSGWGCAKNKINKLVIACDTRDEVLIVLQNAENRKEMKYINWTTSKPYYNSEKYLVNYEDKSTYSKWFEKGAF